MNKLTTDISLYKVCGFFCLCLYHRPNKQKVHDELFENLAR